MATSRKSTAAKGKRTTPSAAAPAAKAATAAKKPTGRPPLHTPQLAEAVCHQLMLGQSLKRICKQDGMPSIDTVIRWLHADTAGFCDQYARAREVQAELYGEETIDIADEDES